MRIINVDVIEDEVRRLFIDANYLLPQDVKDKIDQSIDIEQNKASKNILKIMKTNYEMSKKMIYPLCQDTGMAIVFLEIGQDIHFEGGFINDSISRGVERAYKDGYMRCSTVTDPLRRKIRNDNLPPVIHTEIIKGDRLKISVMPKGFGAENQSKLKMFSPGDTENDIINYIAEGIKKTGGKGCSPCAIGVGIGGSFEYSALMAKKALLIPFDRINPDDLYRDLENKILDKINETDVGSQGLGGNITCLSVKILYYPTHIAGLPVAYNYCCHSARHKEVII